MRTQDVFSLRCYDQYGISALVSQVSFRLEPVAASRNVGWFHRLVKSISENVMQYGGKCNHELTQYQQKVNAAKRSTLVKNLALNTCGFL